jgi:hypothetical protein
MIAMSQRLSARKISWDFVVLGNIIRQLGRFMFVDPSEGDRRVVVIRLTLITSNPRLTSPSDIAYAGVLCGRWCISAFIGFSYLG